MRKQKKHENFALIILWVFLLGVMAIFHFELGMVLVLGIPGIIVTILNTILRVK